MKQPKPGPQSAAEVMAELEADPVWVANRAREDAKTAELEAQDRLAEAPLIDELHEVGLDVNSAWDLVNSVNNYDDALPILLEHLSRPYPDRLREGMARAMAVGPSAKFAWDRLVRLYRSEPVDTNAKAGLAVAVSGVADNEVIGELISLARDDSLGPSRVLLLAKLKRSRAPEARSALEGFCDDPVLSAEARRLIGER